MLNNIKSKLIKDKHYKINDLIKNYKIKKELGEGRYGITYLGENNSGELVTIKQLKKGMLNISKEKSFYEPKILKDLKDVEKDYFPKFIDRFKDNDKEGYILEYIEGETFSEILYKNKKVFSKKEIYDIASSLIDIVEVLESKNIIHKDIRVTNVICGPSNKIKLIDFGLARYIDSKRYKKELDYWYIGDFLIHLYYSDESNYEKKSFSIKEKPWYEELNLSKEEKNFLMSLMGVKGKKYKDIKAIKNDLHKLKNNFLYNHIIEKERCN